MDLQQQTLPPEIMAMLKPVEDSIRNEVREALIFSPRPGGGQRIDRVALVFARASDGDNNGTYSYGVTKAMTMVFGKETLEKMRKLRRKAARAGERMVQFDGFNEDRAAYSDYAPHDYY